MRKSLQLQAEMRKSSAPACLTSRWTAKTAPRGRRGRPRGPGGGAGRAGPPGARVAVRVHPVDHPAFEARTLPPLPARRADRLCTSWCPRSSRCDVEQAVAALDAAGARQLPLHVLIESPAAVHRAFDIAAHPRVQSLSFGLMDFVSAHGGAIPRRHVVGRPVQPPAGGARQAGDRLRCHAHGKVPSHCVVTEFSDAQAILAGAARRAARELATPACGASTPRRSGPSWRPLPLTRARLKLLQKCWRLPHKPTGLPSVLAASCMTGRATVTTGRCWSGRTRPGGRCPTTCARLVRRRLH
jgi:citrate lyase subunit beta/citryl-CoA lyase